MNDSSAKLRLLLLSRNLTPGEQQSVFQEVHDAALGHSRYMNRQPNFQSFHPDDLEHMFHQYDQRLFEGSCAAALNGRRLSFTLSKRLTRAGGKTIWTQRRHPRTGVVTEDFEIAISSHLLFQSFREEDEIVTVTGMECLNRLEAMQRIVEHELIHLAERLAWADSNCRARRFQSIASRLFGHQAHTHELVTTSRIAREKLGIRPGTRVAFQFEGRDYEGVVNRITKRCTVLVPDPGGQRYSDGIRYTKFYIPLRMLQSVGQ